MTELKQRLLNLEAGDPIEYKLLGELEKSENLEVETHNYYHDTTGFLEGWRIGKKAEIVVNGLGHHIMVKRVDNIEEEITE